MYVCVGVCREREREEGGEGLREALFFLSREILRFLKFALECSSECVKRRCTYMWEKERYRVCGEKE
jgi:hypothetical protein